MTNIPSVFKKSTILETQIAAVTGHSRKLARWATVIVGASDNIDIPSATLTDGKNHKLKCLSPIGTVAYDKEHINLENYSANSYNYCEDDYNGDKVGFLNHTNGEIVRTVAEASNRIFSDGLMAGSTAGEDLNIEDKAAFTSYITEVKLRAERKKFVWGPSVKNGKVLKSAYHGKPVIFAGSTSYVRLLSMASSVKSETTHKPIEIEDGYFKLTNGVYVVDMNTLFANPNQIVDGIGGAIFHIYNDKTIKTWDKEINSEIKAGQDSGEVLADDDVVKFSRNMGATVKNEAIIPENVQSVMIKRLATEEA